VVIPTFNERDNIALLLARLAMVLPAGATQIIFVDDSTDDTPRVIEALAKTLPMPVTVHHREHATGGLGGAVLEGLRLARGEWIVVMDADLQHPPEVVPDLIAAGRRDGADLVVASRYVGSGNRDGLANGLRRWVSRSSTALAKLLFRGALRRISDPMSGFFAVRSSSLELTGLRPLGYKILMELAVRTRPPRVVEVPFRFQARHAGESKADLREGVRFLRHLAILKLGGTRLRMLGVAAIGASGLAPNLASLWVFSHVLGLHYLVGAVLANQVALVWNFLLTELLFHRRRHRSLVGRLSRYFVMGNVDLAVRVPALVFLVSTVHMGVLWASFALVVASSVFRFLILDRVIYAARPKPGEGNVMAA
jgi:dolichol-phosphate mannosyltransferase